MERVTIIDPCSFSEPEKAKIYHMDMHWNIDFELKKISGYITYLFIVYDKKLTSIVLDTRDLKIHDVNFITHKEQELKLEYSLGNYHRYYGTKLIIKLPNKLHLSETELKIRIDYETSPTSSGLHWLKPEQTFGNEHPFLFSQSSTINARSIMPCQDTPNVKFTFYANIIRPCTFTVLMTGILIYQILHTETTTAHFKQNIPIPSYLFAIVVGVVKTAELKINSQLFAEECIHSECLKKMSIAKCIMDELILICGRYEWQQLNFVVMPSIYCNSGWEFPNLIYIAPALITNELSFLPNVLTHQMAHSWAGNLVSIKNFEHIWLIKGFATFLESKILTKFEGPEEGDLYLIRSLITLQHNIETYRDSYPSIGQLVLKLNNCPPDEAYCVTTYMKGCIFLRYLEDTLGGPRQFEKFMTYYFNSYKYKSITSNDFKNCLIHYFEENDCKNENQAKLNRIDWDEWFYGNDMPPIIPDLNDTLAVMPTTMASLWIEESVAVLRDTPLIQDQITETQLLYLLKILLYAKKVADFSYSKMEFLDKVYGLENHDNYEVRCIFYQLCAKGHIHDKIPKILSFLNSNYRSKFICPLYNELFAWPAVRPIAVENFKNTKSQMMPDCADLIRGFFSAPMR